MYGRPTRCDLVTTAVFCKLRRDYLETVRQRLYSGKGMSHGEHAGLGSRFHTSLDTSRAVHTLMNPHYLLNPFPFSILIPTVSHLLNYPFNLIKVYVSWSKTSNNMFPSYLKCKNDKHACWVLSHGNRKKVQLIFFLLTPTLSLRSR